MTSNENNTIPKRWKRNCPGCNDELYYSNVYKRNRFEIQGKFCRSCCKIGRRNKAFGKPRPEWVKQKISESNKKNNRKMDGENNPFWGSNDKGMSKSYVYKGVIPVSAIIDAKRGSYQW